jgi:hypothetical protein
MSKNKLLTRDNLVKRRRVDDLTCLFCGENELINHLFFQCIVAKRIWSLISEAVGFKIGSSFESMANSWLCNKRFGVVNIVSSTMYWSL